MDPAGWSHTSKPPDNGFGGGFNATPHSVGYSRAATYGRTYRGPTAAALQDPEAIELGLLLTFHHLDYSAKLRRFGGQTTLLAAFYAAHAAGLRTVRDYEAKWSALAGKVEPATHAAVLERLRRGARDAGNFSATVTSWFANLAGVGPHDQLQ